tara:strand:- start:54 stop:419 length:366 start_codon:yes stop_codon:yes gene_type:complete
MEAKELRIGNWIKYNFKMQGWNDVQVCANDFHNGFRDDKFVSMNYKPIPLTEEWLLKFGFEKPYFSWMCDKFHLTEWDEYPLHWIVSFNKNNAVIVLKLKHVHQLQNLYFALTNEELIIKQ